MTWLLSPVAFAAKWLQAGSQTGSLSPAAVFLYDVDQIWHEKQMAVPDFMHTWISSVPLAFLPGWDGSRYPLTLRLNIGGTAIF
jgi:hypothetical protein